MDLPYAFREAGRSWLENVGRLQLEDAVAAHRGDTIPSAAAANRRGLDLLAAPRRQHDLRIAARDFLWIHDPVARQTRVAELRKDRRPAGGLDKLFDPPDAGNERFVPLLEKHAQAAWKARC